MGLQGCTVIIRQRILIGAFLNEHLAIRKVWGEINPTAGGRGAPLSLLSHFFLTFPNWVRNKNNELSNKSCRSENRGNDYGECVIRASLFFLAWLSTSGTCVAAPQRRRFQKADTTLVQKGRFCRGRSRLQRKVRESTIVPSFCATLQQQLIRVTELQLQGFKKNGNRVRAEIDSEASTHIPTR